MIVRSTEAEAQAAARRLLSRLDAATGEQIRRRSLDTSSAGNARQRQLREAANTEGYAEPHLWTGIGRARSGAGAAIVGDPDQVLAKLRAYQALGMEAFILSGYPHVAEGDLFARHVLPRLDHAPLFARLAPDDTGATRGRHGAHVTPAPHATPAARSRRFGQRSQGYAPRTLPRSGWLTCGEWASGGGAWWGGRRRPVSSAGWGRRRR